VRSTRSGLRSAMGMSCRARFSLRSGGNLWVAVWLHFMVFQVINLAEVLQFSRLATMLPSRDLRYQ